MLEILSSQLLFISLLGENPVLILAYILPVAIMLYKKKHLKTALVVLLTPVSILYSVFLKTLFKWSRPQEAAERYLENFEKYGFPSTHVIFYVTFWGFLFYLSFKYVKKAKLLLHIIRWTSVYMMVSVGSSRIFLEAHFIKDVIGGYLFGLLFLLSLIWLDKKLGELPTKD